MNPERRLPEPVKRIWSAPLDEVQVEKLEGAEGEVKVADGVIVIDKTNDTGRIVVTAPAFKVEKGREIRIFADVECAGDHPRSAQGYITSWTTKRTLTMGGSSHSTWFAEPFISTRINTAPGTPYRKCRHCRPDADSVTAAIVVGGAAGKSVWRNWGAEDLEAAQADWDERFKAGFCPQVSYPTVPEVDFDRALAADIDHTAEVVTVDGRSMLHIDGRPVPPIAYKTCEWTFSSCDTYAGKPLQDLAGVKIAVMDLRLGDLGFEPFRGPWSAEGFDVKAAVAQIRRRLRSGDKSLFVLALGTSAYPEFTEKEHPDEVWIKEDGSVARGNSGSVIPDRYNDGGRPDPGDRRWPWVSPASPAWRAAVKRVTGELFAELRRQGLLKRVIGVHYYGYHDGQFAMPILDYSPCAKADYRRYLAEKGLKETDPEGTFSFFSKQLGFRALEDFSREAKRLAGKPILAVRWCMSPFNVSFDIDAFMRSDAVDIIVPQATYQGRLPGTVMGLNAPTASFHLHRKLLWLEFDFRTWQAYDSWGRDIVFAQEGHTARDMSDWVPEIRKAAGVLNARGMGWWMYDMAGGWYRSEELAKDFREVVEVRRELDRTGRGSWHPDVAFVVDEGALANYNQPGGPQVEAPVTLTSLQWPRNAESGVPHETYVATDFYEHPELAKKYRAIVLSGFVEPSEKQRVLIAACESHGTKTLIVKPYGVSAAELNRFAKAAGAFVACEPEVLQVDMSGDFLSVHCLVAGTHEVKLPFRAKTVNLKTGETAPPDSRVRLSMSAGETRWFRIVAEK